MLKLSYLSMQISYYGAYVDFFAPLYPSERTTPLRYPKSRSLCSVGVCEPLFTPVLVPLLMTLAMLPNLLLGSEPRDVALLYAALGRLSRDMFVAGVPSVKGEIGVPGLFSLLGPVALDLVKSLRRSSCEF